MTGESCVAARNRKIRDECDTRLGTAALALAGRGQWDWGRSCVGREEWVGFWLFGLGSGISGFLGLWLGTPCSTWTYQTSCFVM